MSVVKQHIKMIMGTNVRKQCDATKSEFHAFPWLLRRDQAVSKWLELDSLRLDLDPLSRHLRA